MNWLVWFFLYFLVPIDGLLYFRYGSINCTRNGVICSSETTYTFCYRIGNYIVHLNEEIDCGSGYVCSAYNHFPCVPSDVQIESANETTTQKLTIASTTNSTPATSTTTPSKTSSLVTTFEATTTPTTTEITSTTINTPNSTITTPKISTSTQEITSTISPITTTTTIQPIVEPPDCKGASGFYPSSKCNQYYECSPAFLWWWFEPHLKICPDGEAYNGKNGCEPSTTCNI